MQLRNLFTSAMAALLAVTGTAASPIDAASTNDLDRCAPVNCSPTGPDSCNLSIVTVGWPAQHIVGVWDYKCKSLGSFEDLPENGTFTLKTGLPLPLTLSIARPFKSELPPRGFVMYKGLTTNLDTGVRNNCNDAIIATECMRVAFPCA